MVSWVRLKSRVVYPSIFGDGRFIYTLSRCEIGRKAVININFIVLDVKVFWSDYGLFGLHILLH